MSSWHRGVSPTSLTINEPTTTGTFEVWNCGDPGSTLSYTITESCNWLSVNPTDGSSTGEHDDITVTVDFSSFSSGETKTCIITVSGAGDTKTVTVTATAIESSPNLNEIVEIEIIDDNTATNTFCNHDGQVNDTEDISLEVKVKNNGNATAYNITGELSLPSSDLNCCNIDDPFTSFPNISPGSSEWSINDFDFWVYCMPSDEVLDFTLTLNYEDENGTQYESQIDFDIDVGEEPIPIIDSAILQLEIVLMTPGIPFSSLQLYKCNSYFNESGNCGDFTGGSWGQTGYGSGSIVYWDALDIVEYWIIDGGFNYGFWIYPDYIGEDYNFRFYSRESSSSTRPKLTINYHWEGESGQYNDYTPEMDITYWRCFYGEENGCYDLFPPDSGRIMASWGYYDYNCQQNLDSILTPKIYFDIKRSDF
ncbi:MAG: BACON domain-containing protein [Candidatus Cloacimonetes bacterium]|nr:BACON domain-containing protein [Candidatus Cloacimonadota bacterium]